MVAGSAGLAITYATYQLTLSEDDNPCTESLSAAVLADTGRDQELLIDHALLRSPECQTEANRQSGQ